MFNSIKKVRLSSDESAVYISATDPRLVKINVDGTNPVYASNFATKVNKFDVDSSKILTCSNLDSLVAILDPNTLQRTASITGILCDDVEILDDSSNIVMYTSGLLTFIMKFTGLAVNWQA